MKFCINCAFMQSTGGQGKTFLQCLRPSLITGEVAHSSYTSCKEERYNISLCGPEGRFFRQKEEAEKLSAAAAPGVTTAKGKIIRVEGKR